MLLAIIMFLLLILAVSIWQRKHKPNDANLGVGYLPDGANNKIKVRKLIHVVKWSAVVLVTAALVYYDKKDAIGYAWVGMWILFGGLKKIKFTRLEYRPVIWPNGKKGPYMWQDPEK